MAQQDDATIQLGDQRLTETEARQRSKDASYKEICVQFKSKEKEVSMVGGRGRNKGQKKRGKHKRIKESSRLGLYYEDDTLVYSANINPQIGL